MSKTPRQERKGETTKEAVTREPGKKPPIMCFNCRQEGHKAVNCPGESVMLCDPYPATGSKSLQIETWRRSGKVEGKYAQGAHGDTVLYPLAKVNMEINGIPIEVEAAVSSTLPVSVLLGEDVPELKQLVGSNAVSTGSGAEDVKKQLEDEIGVIRSPANSSGRTCTA